MNEIIEKKNIENMIYEIRGKEVMLDSDLAKLYDVETKRINEAVKNNPMKFPERYAFRIDENEYMSLKSKISTSKGGSRKGHTAFAEQGVYMLATILRSKVAVEVSIAIMDTFVKMRHYINYNNVILPNKFMLLENKVDENTERISKLFDMFDPKVIPDNYICFNGEYYDAYSKVQEIFKKAKKELVIIDGYADMTILDIVKRLKTNVTLITKPNRLLSEQDIERYNMQYDNLKVIFDDTFHDRYFIIDKKEVYHCGTSVNKIGARTFSINRICDDGVRSSLIKWVYEIIKNSKGE